MTLKQLVEETDTWAGRAFDLAIQALIFLSLVTFSLDTLPHLDSTTKSWLRLAEIVTVAVFTVEYALRICVADDRRRFIFSFYGLVDLLAIAPFYIAAGVDLRGVRVLRLFRVFRIFKFVRYLKAIRRLKTALVKIREELVLCLMATSALVFFAAVGIYYFEGRTQPEAFGSIFHCLWWAIVTMTTVGYGDVYPVTVGGRVFTGLLLLVGVGIIAVPTGLFAAALTSTRAEDGDSNGERPSEPGPHAGAGVAPRRR